MRGYGNFKRLVMESQNVINKLNVNYTSLNLLYPIKKERFFENYYKGVCAQYDRMIKILQKDGSCGWTVREKNRIFIIKRDLRLYINDLKTKK